MTISSSSMGWHTDTLGSRYMCSWPPIRDVPSKTLTPSMAQQGATSPRPTSVSTPCHVDADAGDTKSVAPQAS